jgi:RimJ/RimL family protein N-acetyltransferase
MDDAPTLLTDRLILRPHVLADLDAMTRLWGDPEVTRHITGAPQTSAETWQRLQRQVGHWALMGYGYWAVTDRAGAFLGSVGLADHRRALDPPCDLAPEAGWALVPAAHGRGIGFEAMSAALAWADAYIDAPCSHCIVSPGHAASLALARKLGFLPAAPSSMNGAALTVLRRPNSTFY